MPLYNFTVIVENMAICLKRQAYQTQDIAICKGSRILVLYKIRQQATDP